MKPVSNSINGSNTINRTSHASKMWFVILGIAILIAGGGIIAIAVYYLTKNRKVDCVLADEWGACSKKCGGGTQTRKVKTPADHGGKLSESQRLR